MLIWPLGVYADYGGNQNKDLPETSPIRRASPRSPNHIHRLMTPTTLSTHRPTAFHARTTERAARAPRHDRHTTGAKNGPETGAPPTLAPLLPAPRLSRLPAPRSRPGAEFDAFEPRTSLLFSLA